MFSSLTNCGTIAPHCCSAGMRPMAAQLEELLSAWPLLLPVSYW